MRRTLVFACLLVLFQIAAAGLFAQDVSDSTAVSEAIKAQAEMAFDLLYKADASAADYIDWDDFYYNDEDITMLYYDAIDAGTEADFFVSTINIIATDLHYNEGVSDPYVDWEYEVYDSGITATCHNSVSSVQLMFYPPEDEHLLIYEIYVTYR